MNWRAVGCLVIGVAVFVGIGLLGMSFAFRAQPGCPPVACNGPIAPTRPQGTPAPSPAFATSGEAVPIGSTFFGLTTRQMYGPPGSSPSAEADDRPETIALDCADGTYQTYAVGRHQPQPGPDGRPVVVASARRPILLLVNPTSGGKPAAPGLRRRSARAGGPRSTSCGAAAWRSSCSVLAEGDDPGRWRPLRRQGRDVVVAGGDGTVRPAPTALVGTSATLGIVPLGSWNNIARGCGIPQDPLAALAAGLGGSDARSGRRPGVAPGGGRPGSGGATHRRCHDRLLRSCRRGAGRRRLRRGEARGAAWEPGARCATAGRRSVAVARPMRLVVDGRRLRTAAPAVTVCNGPYHGLGFAVAPDADPADGLLDLVVFSGMSRLDVIRHYLAVARGRPRREPRMSYLIARRIRVDSARPLPVHADGEPLGTTPIAFAVRPARPADLRAEAASVASTKREAGRSARPLVATGVVVRPQPGLR